MGENLIMKYYAAYATRKQAMPEDIFAEFDNFEDARKAAHAALVVDDSCAVYIFIGNFVRVWLMRGNQLLVSTGPDYSLMNAFWTTL